MQTTRFTIEIEIGTLEQQQMPQEDELCHHIIEHLYDHVIMDAAIVQTVHITEINGRAAQG